MKTDPESPELSVVMPCLNEADTLEVCIQKARQAIDAYGVNAEILIADNGSTDGSIEIAQRNGARVVHVPQKGYGSALMGGIEAATGKYVLMGDADDSYNFLEIPNFLDEIRKGYDLVQGCRLPSGGGRVLPGAMPFLHRWLGNPMLSMLVRTMFGAPIHDVYCGMRIFTKECYRTLNQRCTGMEFATEMIIKSTLQKKSISEVPITLHPDGRKAHAPHLKTFRDGWRTLRFFLLCSPRWLFLIPGVVLMLLGALGYGLVYSNAAFNGLRFDAHTLLFATLFVMMGYQAVLFAVMSKTFAISEKLLPFDERMNAFFRIFNLERGIIGSLILLILGSALLLIAVNQWGEAQYGPLNYAQTMRWVIPGVLLAAIGFQTLLFGFFTSLLGMARKID